MEKTEISSEFTNRCSLLCFVSDEFIEYSTTYNLLSRYKQSYSLLQLVSASLEIIDGSEVYNQVSLFDSFISSLTISGSKIYDIPFEVNCITIANSNLTFINSEITNIQNINDTEFMLVLMDSVLTVTSSSYTSSKATFFKIRTSRIYVDDLTMNNITSAYEIMQIRSCDVVHLFNINMSDLQSEANEIVSVRFGSDVYFSNVTAKNIPALVFHTKRSSVEEMDNLYIENCYQGVSIEYSMVKVVSNSVFRNNGDEHLHYAGGIFIHDANTTTRNCSFYNNIAEEGGAIVFECDHYDICGNEMFDNYFESNIATEKGGAVYFEFNRPGTTNITYFNNSAPYGPDIASYAVKVTLLNESSNAMKISNFGSGVAPDEPIVFAVKDFDDQILAVDSIQKITITAIDGDASAEGTNNELLYEGIAEFDNIRFTASPGKSGVMFRAVSDIIDSEKVEIAYQGTVLESTIEVDFRYCKPGEAKTSPTTCTECTAGTYAFTWSSNTCYD